MGDKVSNLGDILKLYEYLKFNIFMRKLEI